MNPSLQRKLRRSMEPASADVVEALRSLTGLLDENTASSRRALLGRIEQRGLDLSRSLLATFGELQSSLDAADAEVDCLTDACTTISTRLHDSRAATEVLLSQTERLRVELAATEKRSAETAAFEAAYCLSSDDETLLNSPFGGAGAPFGPSSDLQALLGTLGRVQAIRERAQDLLLGPQQPLGLEITSSMAAHEERGLGLLYRWVQAQCRALPVEARPSAAAPLQASLRQAIAALRHRPELLSYCLDEVVASRRQPLLAAWRAHLSYLDAATAGSATSRSRGPEGVGAEGAAGERWSEMGAAAAVGRGYVEVAYGGAGRRGRGAGDEEWEVLECFERALCGLQRLLRSEHAILSALLGEGSDKGGGQGSGKEGGEGGDTEGSLQAAGGAGGVGKVDEQAKVGLALASASEPLAEPLTAHVCLLLSISATSPAAANAGLTTAGSNAGASAAAVEDGRENSDATHSGLQTGAAPPTAASTTIASPIAPTAVPAWSPPLFARPAFTHQLIRLVHCHATPLAALLQSATDGGVGGDSAGGSDGGAAASLPALVASFKRCAELASGALDASVEQLTRHITSLADDEGGWGEGGRGEGARGEGARRGGRLAPGEAVVEGVRAIEALIDAARAMHAPTPAATAHQRHTAASPSTLAVAPPPQSAATLPSCERTLRTLTSVLISASHTSAGRRTVAKADTSTWGFGGLITAATATAAGGASIPASAAAAAAAAASTASSSTTATATSASSSAGRAGGVPLPAPERIILLLNSLDALRIPLLAVRQARSSAGVQASAQAGEVGGVVVGGGEAGGGARGVMPALHDHVGPSLALVEAECTAALAELARTSAEEFMRSCGLGEKLAALQTAEAQPQVPMATMIGLEPLALAASMRSFYSTLFQRGDALVASVELLSSAALGRQAVLATARTLAATHQHITSLVLRPGAGYEQPGAILLHTPEEVQTLLDVQ